MNLASHLLSGMEADRDRLFLDTSGEVQPEPPEAPAASAVVVVAEVTDALKRLLGNRVGTPVDREGVMRASGFVLSREVLAALGPRWLDPTTLYDDVEALGYSWVVWMEGTAPRLREDRRGP